jgi:hypothetical protein
MDSALLMPQKLRLCQHPHIEGGTSNKTIGNSAHRDGDERTARMLHFSGFFKKFLDMRTFNLDMGTGSP